MKRTAGWNLGLSLFYLGLIAAAGVIFAAIQDFGSATLVAPPPLGGADTFPGSRAAVRLGEIFHVLLAMAAVILVGRGLGTIFRRLHQPPVVGDVIAGILLGPTLLGWISPGVHTFLFPADIIPHLEVIAQLGIILYMFLVGLELNPGLLKGTSHVALAVSHTSIVIPFLLGASFALVLYPRLATNDVPFTIFALFLGVSLSITAFPVLARILTDRGLSRSRLGTLALACAAVDDVTAWCLLALVVGIAHAQMNSAVVTVGFTAVYIVLMFGVARPLILRSHLNDGGRGKLTQGAVALVFLAVLISSMTTEVIGVHALFGAFLIGAVIPHDSRVAREFTNNLQDIVGILLLPAFFALTGLRTEIGLVRGLENLVICLGIILLATLGKFCGSALTARFYRIPWRDSAALGILMNTRGLMELIVLNIGLELKVISPTLFAMLVIMSIVTTVTTTPILDFLLPGASLTRPPAEQQETDPLEISALAGG